MLKKVILLIGYSAWYYDNINSSTDVAIAPNANIEKTKAKNQFDYVKVEDQSLIGDTKEVFEDKSLNVKQINKENEQIRG